MNEKVVHCKKDNFDIYIGRPSKWGNPFSHVSRISKYRTGSREESIEKHKKWILTQSDLIREAKRELKNKILGCWCSPKECHGDILTKIASES